MIMAETGTYTSPKRVERDGYLVAFEGEEMTMAEAHRRGLVKPEKPAEKKAASKTAAKK